MVRPSLELILEKQASKADLYIDPSLDHSTELGTGPLTGISSSNIVCSIILGEDGPIVATNNSLASETKLRASIRHIL